MSTKAIRRLIAVARNMDARVAADAALAEVEDIEKAAPAIIAGAAALLFGFAPAAEYDKALGVMKSIKETST
jgi:hypothetical protein